MAETKLIYYVDDEQTPYKINVPISQLTLADFKNALNRTCSYKYFFKSMDDDFGVVKEEIVDDDAHLPCFDGRVVSWLVTAEGSNTSDGASQCTETAPHQDTKHNRVDHVTPGHTKRPPLPLNHDDTLTETESIISSRQGHHLHRMSKREKYNKFNESSINDHFEYLPVSCYKSAASSDWGTMSFMKTDNDERSRVTSTTRRHSNMSSIVKSTTDRRRPKRYKKHRLPPISKASSFSTITDSAMSLNTITVFLNMSTVHFLGISIVGNTNGVEDDGIYVEDIKKGGAVAADGRIQIGDMILQVNDIDFENISIEEALKVLKKVVKKPGPIKLVVAKCSDPLKSYREMPRAEIVQPIDPGRWVEHTAAAMKSDGFSLRPSDTTMTSPPSSLTSTISDEEYSSNREDLTIHSDMRAVVQAMTRAGSGLEIRERKLLKIAIPNASIGTDLVDWLNKNVKGITNRQGARKYASKMLEAGYIRDVLNDKKFYEWPYYIFSDLCSSTNDKKPDCGTVGPLQSPNMRDMCYFEPYAPHENTRYSPTLMGFRGPMPSNFSNELTALSYRREGSLCSCPDDLGRYVNDIRLKEEEDFIQF